MTTWSFKAPLVALLFSGLTACGAAPLGNFGAGGTAENNAAPQAQMAFGEVTLVPPPGYCIDTRSLSERFAMMARCDVLGAPVTGGDTPLGMIAVSIAQKTDTPSLPSAAQTATALGLTGISSESAEDDRIFFRATGPAPVRQMEAEHWRANAVIAGYVMGVALYGPKGAVCCQTRG